MSKSKGNALKPADLVKVFGVDAYRYYFLSDVQFGHDGSISIERMVQVYNADLANTWGNLCSRVFNMTKKYFEGKVPAAPAGAEENPLREIADELYAEYDNYRKRTAKEKTETYSHATAAAVETLLPALDSFSLALEAACTDEAYKTGMEKIYTQLNEALKKLGVREMEALGTPFDPNFHHAIKQAADTEYEEGMVCQVFQKGYLIGDRVIRHAMVAVAQ